MIICASIKVKFIDADHTVKDIVVSGHRHGDCFKVIRYLCLYEILEKTQGFINHKGEFLDRKAALEHAKDCGQLTATHRYYQEDHNINEMYSEDLY